MPRSPKPSVKSPKKKRSPKASPKTRAGKSRTPTQQRHDAQAPGRQRDDVIAARVAALTHAFAALGAQDPERWAKSHVQEGIDQIGRFVFLRALWSHVVKDGRFVDKQRKDQTALRPVVDRLLSCGASEDDLVRLVRALQVQLLVDVCQILDDPSDNDEGVRWGLWRMDKRGLPLWQLPELRLDVLDVDPLAEE